jgi:hypothetical protein
MVLPVVSPEVRPLIGAGTAFGWFSSMVVLRASSTAIVKGQLRQEKMNFQIQ